MIRANANRLTTFIRFCRLMREVTPKLLALDLFLRVLIAVLPAIQMIVLKWLFDDLYILYDQGSAHLSSSLAILAIHIALLFAAQILRSLESLIMVSLKAKAVHHVDLLIIGKSSRIPLYRYEESEFLNLLSRIGSGFGLQGFSILENGLGIIQGLVTIGSYFVALSTIHWSLPLGLLLLAVPTLILHMKIGDNRFALMMHQTETIRKNAYFFHILTGKPYAKERKVFQLSPFFQKRWQTTYWNNANAQLVLEKKAVRTKLLVEGFGLAASAASLGYMIGLVAIRGLAVGSYAAVSQTVITVSQTAQDVAFQLSRLYETSLYVQQLYLFLETPEEESSTGFGGTFPRTLEQGLDVRNLRYRYPGRDQDTLQDLSFRVGPRETLAIVGENGAGKSTLVHCLTGMFREYEGQVRYDGVELKTCAPSDVFDGMSAIFQDFGRYDISVRHNIAFERADEEGREEEIAAAVSRTGADAVVSRLPEGFGTLLGNSYLGGIELSQGQWQKIALSRALFKSAPVTVMDEPTSALDPDTEAKLFESFLNRPSPNGISILVSHRLASCRNADLILVMKQGRVIEQGNHHRLMALNGEYARMFRLQANAFAGAVGSPAAAEGF